MTQEETNQDNVAIDIELITERCLRERGQALGIDTYDQVISHLLDITTEAVSLEAVVTAGMEHFDHVAGVYVAHPPLDECEKGTLYITVYTGDVFTAESRIDLFSPRHRIEINGDEDGGERQYRFELYASCDGPNYLNNLSGTPVYMAEDVHGAEALPLETGIRYLSNKLMNPDEWETPNELRVRSIKEAVE